MKKFSKLNMLVVGVALAAGICVPMQAVQAVEFGYKALQGANDTYLKSTAPKSGEADTLYKCSGRIVADARDCPDGAVIAVYMEMVTQPAPASGEPQKYIWDACVTCSN